MPTRTCPVCGKEFHRTPNAVLPVNYCSDACRNSGLFRGPGNGRWKGGTYVQNGYRFVLMPDRSYRQEHRVVMEAHLGRPLLPTEVVHHINGDKADNRPENLKVLSGQGEHRKHHAPTRGLPVHDWISRGGGCVDCGETARPHYAKGLCTRCYQRVKHRE